MLTEDGEPVARVGFFAHPSCPPELRGDLPVREYRLFGLIPPPSDSFDAGASFLGDVVTTLPTGEAVYVDGIVNREYHEDAAFRCRLLEAAGMELFQEKHGYQWEDSGDRIVVPSRLSFESIDAVGDDRYFGMIAARGRARSTATDAWYWGQTGAENWGRVFGSYVTGDDRDMWLVGSKPTGEPVGFIAIPTSRSMTPTSGTVHPWHR